MAPKRKAFVQEEEGDTIVVLPRRAPAISSTAIAHSSTNVAASNAAPGASNSETRPTANTARISAWSAREKLELLLIHRDHNMMDRSGKARTLNDRTARFRPLGQPARTEHELTPMLRELQNAGVTTEQLEAEIHGRTISNADATNLPKPKRKKRKVDQEQEYRAKAILRETDTHFLISWEDDEETGEQFADSWEPKKNANQSLIDDWEARKEAGEAGP